MCNNFTQQNWEDLFDRAWSSNQDEVNTARLVQQLSRFPKEGFKYLLMDYCCQNKRISPEQLEEKLLPRAEQLFMGIIIFNNWFEQFLLNIARAEKSNDLIKQLAYLRRFCRKMLLVAQGISSIPLPGKNQISGALERMVQTDAALQQANLDEKLPFDAHEVFSQLSHYVEKGQALADSPAFLPLYLSVDELAPLFDELDNKRLTAFSKKYLKNLILQGRLKHIKRVLKKLIFEDGVQEQSMHAYAIYLTIEQENYDLIDHPFVRRFIYNSFLEGKLKKVMDNK